MAKPVVIRVYVQSYDPYAELMNKALKHLDLEYTEEQFLSNFWGTCWTVQRATGRGSGRKNRILWDLNQAHSTSELRELVQKILSEEF